MASTVNDVREIRRSQRAEGPAAMLAIGTANPANCVSQDEFADYYFRVTKSEHLTDLKATFQKICQLTGMKNRYFYHTEELLNAHPELLDHKAPSLDIRHDIVATAAPELAASAAAKAIAMWGRPATDITHLIVSTNSDASAPGVTGRLASLLGLRPDVCRASLQLNGCTAGCAALRLSKDLAENNRGARVLVVCVELTLTAFRGPNEEDTFDTLINQALFSDGAGAVIVGADPVGPAEHPLFEMVAASQAVIPDTDDVVTIGLGQSGIRGVMSTRLPGLAADNVEKCLQDAFGPLGISVEWNDLFWAVHAGSALILDYMDKVLGLDAGRLASGRTVVKEYGNMLGVTVIFVLDELQRQMAEEEGKEEAKWGVMMGFGPGFAIETMVLHAAGNLKKN